MFAFVDTSDVDTCGEKRKSTLCGTYQLNREIKHDVYAKRQTSV